MSPSVSSLPEFIHIATGVQHGGSLNTNARANASHPPPCTPPPNALHKYKTPRKGLLPRRGILKSPSYKFTGIRINSSKDKAQKKQSQKEKQQQQLKQQEPSTPTTVGTNESFEDGDSISRTSSCGSSTIGSAGTFGTTSSEGIKKAIDRIIRNKTQSISLTNKSINIDITKNSSNSSNSIDKSNNNSMSSSVMSVTSNTTSSTSVSTATATSTSVCSNNAGTKEELQRCARIKHIEDLNERINHARARKLVERKAYRREDKLLLRLARQLKTVSKRSRDNGIGIQMLEESNQVCEDYYNRTLQELADLRSSRSTLKENLLAEKQQKVADDREKRERILRVQQAEVEAHKRSHQFNCQALCESVLEANNELDRMRALWEEHYACDGSSSLQTQQKGGNSRNQKRQMKRKPSRPSRWAVLIAVVMVVAMAAFVILATTSVGTDTTPELATTLTTIKEQHRLYPPLSLIRSGIILDENIAASPSTRTIMTRPTATAAATTAFYSKNDTDFSGPSMNGSGDGDNSMRNTEITISNTLTPLFSETNKSCKSNSNSNEGNDISKTKTTSSACISSLTTKTETTNQRGKREQHRFKPKEAITRLFRN